MIQYHGTTYNIWRNIAHDGFIAKATKENSPYSECGSLATEYGYVYLVGNFIEAIEYASWAWSSVNMDHHLSRRLLVVIKVDVPEEELETDFVDNQRRPMTYKKGPYYKIERNIEQNEIIEIAAFQYDSFEASCTEIDRIINNTDSSIIKWCEPTSIPFVWNGTAHMM